MDQTLDKDEALAILSSTATQIINPERICELIFDFSAEFEGLALLWEVGDEAGGDVVVEVEEVIDEQLVPFRMNPELQIEHIEALLLEQV